MCLQLASSIHKISSLDNSLIISNSSLIYENDGKIFIMDFNSNTQECILLKHSKLESQNVIKGIRKMPSGGIICLSKTQCFKFVKLEESKRVKTSFQVTFQCEYCLGLFGSHRDLSKIHLAQHYGPVNCTICKVSFTVKSPAQTDSNLN